MSLVCRDGVSACLACGLCFESDDRCDVCKRPMKDGEKYYRLSRKNVCVDCTDTPAGEKCILCQKPAKNGLRYKDIVLCRSCSGVATGYVGYI
ncbi:MAG: hypothetical protein E7647_03845 [Ruminococcaceae bacterium]|nr:hypothetical protein [Oscillospiraceae bacterium]